MTRKHAFSLLMRQTATQNRIFRLPTQDTQKKTLMEALE